MRLSRFVLTYKDVRPGEHVLYDIVKDHYVGVDEPTLEGLERWATSSPANSEEQEVHDLLREEGFLVADRQEDDQRLRGFLERASEGAPGTMYITLMPTLICNLACNYCFQKDFPSFTKMNDPMEASTVEWILRRVDGAASRKLVIHYFGGEPLTRKDLLLRSAEIFSSAMAARGGAFEWEITTNGLGLSVDFVNQMLSFGPGSIKVTIDGDKETHDAARVYRSGKGSFDEIFQKTVDVTKGCPDLKMRIGGIYLPAQVASYEKLLDRLEAAGMKGLLEEVRFKPIVDTDDEEGTTCTSCASSTKETDTLVQLRTSIAARGISRTSPSESIPAGPCELHWKHSYIIDPEGFVYKCPAVAGRSEMAITSVTAPSPTRDRVAPLLELRPWEQCGDCPFMPVCVGGCLGGQFLQTGKRDQVFCKKTSFEAVFATNVKERYLDEFAPAVQPAQGGIPEAFTEGEERHEEVQRES